MPHLRDGFIVAKGGIRAVREPFSSASAIYLFRNKLSCNSNS
jgi:hypothetical protein